MITDETARLIREADVKLMFDDGVPVIANLDKFAALVAAAERDKIQAGYERLAFLYTETMAEYERLAFLHTETMAELVRVQRHLDCISANWWELLKHRIKTILGIKAKEDT